MKDSGDLFLMSTNERRQNSQREIWIVEFGKSIFNEDANEIGSSDAMTFYTNNATFFRRTSLLHFLPLALLVSRLAPQPNTHKSYPSGNCNPHARNPDPTCTNLPTAWPFVVSEMSDRHFPFDIHVGQERSLVIDAERKDAMLIWKLERTAEDSAVGCLRNGYKIETMIG